MTFNLKSMYILFVATALTYVFTDAHGIISFPRATYINETADSSWNTRINASQTRAAFQGLKWDDTPVNNAITFTAAYKVSGCWSLKQMVNEFVPGCQNTRTDVPVKIVKGNNTMVFRNDHEHAGFVQTYHGPCEIWIGNTRVFNNNDCSAAYQDYPAIMPVNDAKCKRETCILTFYWLAVHEPMWQIYKQCVRIALS